MLGVVGIGEIRPSALLLGGAKGGEVPEAVSIPWRFGELRPLEKSDVLWSHLSLNDVPIFSVREDVPVYR